MPVREFNDAVFEHFARVGAALDSPKRVETVDLLAQGERSMESTAEVTGMSVANTSRHPQVLRSAGLLASRRDARYIRYRLVDPSATDGYLALRRLAEARIEAERELSTAVFDDVDGVEPVMIEGFMTRIQWLGHGRRCAAAAGVRVRSPARRREHPVGGTVRPRGRTGHQHPDGRVLPRAVLRARSTRRFAATRRRGGCPAPGRRPIEWHAAGLPLGAPQPTRLTSSGPDTNR